MSKLYSMDGSDAKLPEAYEALAEQLAPHIIELGKMCVEFSETYRATSKDPEGTMESDTDHTVMLGVIACSIAEKYAPELNLGKVAQFALVHDLVEVYAKDTSTIFIDEKIIKDKDAQESLALARIDAQFKDVLPWAAEIIEEYKRLDTPEARFIKVLDKLMPALTNLFDNGLTLERLGVHSSDDLARSVNGRKEKMITYAYDQPLAMALREQFVKIMQETFFNKTD